MNPKHLRREIGFVITRPLGLVLKFPQKKTELPNFLFFPKYLFIVQPKMRDRETDRHGRSYRFSFMEETSGSMVGRRWDCGSYRSRRLMSMDQLVYSTRLPRRHLLARYSCRRFTCTMMTDRMRREVALC